MRRAERRKRGSGGRGSPGWAWSSQLRRRPRSTAGWANRWCVASPAAAACVRPATTRDPVDRVTASVGPW